MGNQIFGALLVFRHYFMIQQEGLSTSELRPEYSFELDQSLIHPPPIPCITGMLWKVTKA